MAKASSSQAWLWHRHLSHLNFDTINFLSKYDIVTGLPKLKFLKDHLCSSCELEKAKIRNKDLHDETERISKESKDVSNERKTTDTVCNDAFEVTQELSKRIVELEKDLSKFEAKKANMGKLNAFDNENCDFESKVIHLEKVVLERQLARKVDDSKAEKDQFLKEINHLRTQLENLKGKSVKTKFDKHSILGKPPADKLLINSQISKSWFTPKVDMQKSLSKPVTAQSLPKNEKDQLLKRIAYLESKLASQDIRSCQKEYHELRTLYNALKVKFDSLNRKRRETNVSKSSKPRESVSAKVHTGESSKPFSRRVSQFTTYSLQKDRKFSKNSQSFETLTPQKGFKKRASNAKHQSFETTYSCFTPVIQVWRPIKESQTFEASSSQKSFKTSTLKGKNQVFVTPHSRFTPVKQAWRPKQSHSKSFKYSKSEMLSMQNKNDSASIINKNGRFSNEAKTNFRNVSSNDNHKWKSSSSTRFKTPHETPSFKNQWKIKRNFKSPLIPRELFSNETPVSSPRWNSTSLHRIDTTLKWFSKLGKPVSTVLKWVPKVVV
ncbi:outer membrane protein porin [Tanacetum coccineum]